MPVDKTLWWVLGMFGAVGVTLFGRLVYDKLNHNGKKFIAVGECERCRKSHDREICGFRREFQEHKSNNRADHQQIFSRLDELPERIVKMLRTSGST